MPIVVKMHRLLVSEYQSLVLVNIRAIHYTACPMHEYVINTHRETFCQVHLPLPTRKTNHCKQRFLLVF